MGLILKSDGENKKPYTIEDRSDVIIDESMKDYSNEPFFVEKLADAKRYFKADDSSENEN
jgi:hypothetical protein